MEILALLMVPYKNEYLLAESFYLVHSWKNFNELINQFYYIHNVCSNSNYAPCLKVYFLCPQVISFFWNW